MSTTRRGFLAGLGAIVGGVALQEAIPFNRVWSFPTNIRIFNPSVVQIHDWFRVYEPGDRVLYDEQIWEITGVYYNIDNCDIRYEAINHIVSPFRVKPTSEDICRLLRSRRNVQQITWKQTFEQAYGESRNK